MNGWSRSAFVTLCGILFFVSGQGNAWAAEEADPVNSTVGWVFRFVNFAVVFAVVAYVARRYGPKFFRTRRDRIVSAMVDAAHTKEEAERRLREIEKKLAGLGDEMEELRAAADREASAEAERIRVLTRSEVLKIERAAQAEIQAAERAGRLELKALAARQAVERAETLIRERLTAGVEASLFRSFLDELARSAN